MIKPPKIENAPGLTWKPRKAGWEARWQCRTDLVERGFGVKSLRLWSGVMPDEMDCAYIASRCSALQADMLVWGRGGIPAVAKFDGTISGLVRCYQTDVDSSYRKTRYRTRLYYNHLCRALEELVWTDGEGVERKGGDTKIQEIKARIVLRWHEIWADQGKIAMAHSVVGMLRILTGFGSTILEDDNCAKVSGFMHNMRFTMAKPRGERVTAEQAIAIRREAHKLGCASVALAQALQFELMLRQKDVIGEWVPMNEVVPLTHILDGNNKWCRGLRWEEIDQNLILRHVTSKRQKEITVDLKIAGMVMEELEARFGTVTHAALPVSGPIIISERSGLPWYPVEFRNTWRKAANNAGVPKTVRNMDSRAGAISEATDSGADLEHVRHAATHSDIGMTQKYSRNDVEKTAGVMLKRAAHRSKKGEA